MNRRVATAQRHRLGAQASRLVTETTRVSPRHWERRRPACIVGRFKVQKSLPHRLPPPSRLHRRQIQGPKVLTAPPPPTVQASLRFPFRGISERHLFNQMHAIFLVAGILTNSATLRRCSGIRENSVARSSTEHTAETSALRGIFLPSRRLAGPVAGARGEPRRASHRTIKETRSQAPAGATEHRSKCLRCP